MGENANLVSIHRKARPIGSDISTVRSVDRIVLEEVSECSRVREVVDRDKVQVEYLLLLGGTEHLTPDTPKTVDPDTNGHFSIRSYCGNRSPAAAARPNVT